MGALNGAALGVLFVMTTKLGWLGTILVVVLAAALVGGIYTISVRRRLHGVSSAHAPVTT